MPYPAAMYRPYIIIIHNYYRETQITITKDIAHDIILTENHPLMLSDLLLIYGKVKFIS